MTKNTYLVVFEFGITHPAGIFYRTRQTFFEEAASLNELIIMVTGYEWRKQNIDNITISGGNAPDYAAIVSVKCIDQAAEIIPVSQMEYHKGTPHPMFTPETLKEEILKKWGPAGAHIDVYSRILKQNETLKKAIHWALGYTDFPNREAHHGPYYWRTELRSRSGLTDYELNHIK
jgi:hypothetical protein